MAGSMVAASSTADLNALGSDQLGLDQLGLDQLGSGIATSTVACLSVVDGAKRIAAGQLVAFPTETVYGLGADASNDAAVAKIFAAKGRPADHPLIVHVSDAQAALHFASSIQDFAQCLITAFWPGPLTIIVPRKAGVAAASAGGQDSIGLRCPAHPMSRELLAQCAKLGILGIAAPSANKFGHVSPTTAAHVIVEFGADAPGGEGANENIAGAGALVVAVLDGGACEVGIESTIIDCTRGAPVLLRPGVLTTAQLEAAMVRALSTEALLNSEHSTQQVRRQSAENGLKSGFELDLQQPAARGFNPSASRDNLDPTPREDLRPAPRDILRPAPRASGTLASHYAPQAPLRLMDAKALQTALDLLGSDAKNIAIYARAPLKILSSHITLRRMPSDALATAQQLFAVLREFDAQKASLIWVETVPPDAAWDGVRDRLQRAAA